MHKYKYYKILGLGTEEDWVILASETSQRILHLPSGKEMIRRQK